MTRRDPVSIIAAWIIGLWVIVVLAWLALLIWPTVAGALNAARPTVCADYPTYAECSAIIAEGL